MPVKKVLIDKSGAIWKKTSDKYFFKSLALENTDLDVLKISTRLRRSCDITLKK